MKNYLGSICGRKFRFLMKIVDFVIKCMKILKRISVNIVDVDFLKNLLVDCRQIGQTYCNLHLSPPPHKVY